MDEFLHLVGVDLNGYILAIRSSLNVHCLPARSANMDIQFILDVDACASVVHYFIRR